VHFLITQNVDDLHVEAGSRRVVQLHGGNRVVVCLDCGCEFARAEVERLAALNLSFAEPSDFVVPPCERCGGVLKPAVVFFGESLPPRKVAVAMEHVDEADALLVAARGDALASLKIDATCGATLSAAADAVRSARSPA